MSNTSRIAALNSALNEATVSASKCSSAHLAETISVLTYFLDAYKRRYQRSLHEENKRQVADQTYNEGVQRVLSLARDGQSRAGTPRNAEPRGALPDGPPCK